MNKILRNNRFFLWPFFISWVILAFILIYGQKSEIHLFVNRFHTPFLDVFFQIITYLGDGLLITIMAIIFLFISLRKGFIIGASAIAAGLLSQFFKRVIFSEVHRPKVFFEELAELYFVPGLKIHNLFSFPSGHTTIAFCLFLILANFSKSNLLKAVYFIIAILVAYSRVYLSQHFLIDVFFGALLGSSVTLITIFLLEKIQKNWIDKSLISVFRNNE